MMTPCNLSSAATMKTTKFKEAFSKSVVFFLLLPIPFISFASDIAKHEMERNASIMTQSCFNKQRNNPSNDYLSEAQIKEYCGCNSKKFFSLISKEELDYANKHRTMDNVKDKLRIAEDYCKATLGNKWSAAGSSSKSEYISLSL